MSAGEIEMLGNAYRWRQHRVRDEVADQVTRIAALDPVYRPFEQLAANLELEAARLDAEFAAGRDRGPLHGVTVAIERSLLVTGLRAADGAPVAERPVVLDDAPVVAALRSAGALILGTTRVETANPNAATAASPVVLNPWEPQRVPGGASSGSAVAACLKLGHLHLGVDEDGAVRCPACHCGVVGFLPSTGRLSTRRAQWTTLEATVPPRLALLARCTDDVRIGFRVLTPVVDARPAPPRLLVPVRLVAETADDVTRTLFAAVLAWLEAAGWMLVTGEVDGWREAADAACAVHEARAGDEPSAADVLEARRARCTAFADALRTTLEASGSSAVLTPTWPCAAPPVAELARRAGATGPAAEPERRIFVRAANAAGAAAITLPVGDYPDAGVPFGIQLMVPAGGDEVLLDLAGRLETVLGRGLAPPVVRGDGIS